ncbi:benzoate carboxyl methyltransferase-like [Primulina tabacum]|uniref:benzoate carboxyl methyltransferase-like n=1 Tax=Primulina tabacum TaxID=48773 RepID=UPI003F5A24CE
MCKVVKMESKKVLHMNKGDGETSYAKNSTLQKYAITKTWVILDETLKNMVDNEIFEECCFKMVDFGCASGPNTLLVASHIVDTLQNFRDRFQEIQVFLNDLPDNDFNNLFKLLQNFYKEKGTKMKQQCFVYGSPGSFYDRKFPSKSMHFAYSSYSIHWLSKVPEGLEDNKENIYIAMTSPAKVLEAYANQFRRDFSKFPSARGEEFVCGGRMVLSIVGRPIEDTSSIDENENGTILAEILHDMVVEGLIKKDDLYSFNVPIYTPCPQEVETIISDEGSFKLDRMDGYPVLWDPSQDVEGLLFEKKRSAKVVADGVRAVLEPLMASHFGGNMSYNVVFEKYAEKLAEHLSKEPSIFTIAISLRRK